MISGREIKAQKADNMEEHPEGGSYKRIYCSETIISHPEKGDRAALSHIYFEIGEGEVSHMHRVANDESWNLYKGEGVYIYLWDGTSESAVRVELSEKVNAYCFVIPAGMWQAAEPIGSGVLVGCSVAPAFDFEDFTLLRDESDLSEVFRKVNPDLDRFV